MKASEIISELNEFLFENGVESDEFSLETNGFLEIIKFNECVLWRSDEEDRLWIEEQNDYEPMKPYLIRQVFHIRDKYERISAVLRGDVLKQKQNESK